MNCAECGASENLATTQLPTFWRSRRPGEVVTLCKECLFQYVLENGLGHACWNCGEVTSSMYCSGCGDPDKPNACDYCGDSDYDVVCPDCISHDECGSSACNECGTDEATYCSDCASCSECGDITKDMQCPSCRACDKCGKAKACRACDAEVPIEIIDGEAQVGDVIVRFQN